MNLFKYLNALAADYEPLLKVLDPIIGFIIGFGLINVSRKANRIAESNLELAKQDQEDRDYRIRKDERKIFYSVYKKLIKAIGLIVRDGNVNFEAFTIFWRARDQARLELPKDIQEYVEDLFNTMHRAFIHSSIHLKDPNKGGLKVGEERTNAAEEKSELIAQLMNAKPYEIFSPYMKIKTK